jgi:hypothetical protein
MSADDEGTIGIDGTIEWRDADGELHRVGGPARVFPSGRQEWFRHGRLHREGLRHRGDGPAAIYPEGRKVWFTEGVKVREERT